MYHFIGFLCNQDIQKYYQSITTDLSVRFDIKNLSDRVPAHLTLVYPFESEDTSVIEDKIKNFVRGKAAMNFTLGGFGRFDDNSRTIFIPVKSTQVLSEFVKECIIEIGSLCESEKFDPETFKLHASVASKLSSEISDAILLHLMTLPEPYFLASFDKITLFVFENEMWRVKRIFELG